MKWTRFLCTSLMSLALMAGCSEEPRTEVMVQIDAETGVRTMARTIHVLVYGGVRTSNGVPDELVYEQTIPVTPTGSGWPSLVALAPKDKDASRLYRVRVTALNPSANAIGEVRAISGYVSKKTLLLKLLLQDSCQGVLSCDEKDSCRDGRCQNAEVDPNSLPQFEDSMSDAGVRNDSSADGGGSACTKHQDCADQIACTIDECINNVCQHTPHDSLCTAASGGTCDETNDCQYPICNNATCVSGNCLEAHCDGNLCVRTSQCALGQACCAGSCVSMGCADTNPCTDDSCGTSGCVHEPSTDHRSCDDGLFCNGTEMCAGSDCAAHTGDPCKGTTTCDEFQDSCSGCQSSAECPSPLENFGECENSTDVCATTGTQTVQVTSFECVRGSCQGAISMDMRSCTRFTEGFTCQPRQVSSDSCHVVDAGVCSSQGSTTQTITDWMCSSGVCTNFISMQLSSCFVFTDGQECGQLDRGAYCINQQCIETVCNDTQAQADNDQDNLENCKDTLDCGCSTVIPDAGCRPCTERVCNNGADDDLDGFTDCSDSDCSFVQCDVDKHCQSTGLGTGICTSGFTFDGGIVGGAL